MVIATGVVPGKALAQTAGIEVGRGIRVNAHMETSVAGIYACEDCVETVDACTGEDAMFQLKHNALEQAQNVSFLNQTEIQRIFCFGRAVDHQHRPRVLGSGYQGDGGTGHEKSDCKYSLARS